MIARYIATLLFIAMVLCTSAYSRSVCGTELMIKNRHGQSLAKPSVQSTSISLCNSEDLYDNVYTRTTDHFQIFYTLSGPHKTTAAFVDYLASYVEEARKFHTEKMGMQPPQGISETHHYQKPVKEGLYPVEILDISLVRNSHSVFGQICNECYGATYSPEENNESELMIENDFRHQPSLQVAYDTISKDNQSCVYPRPTVEFENKAHGYSYAEHWKEGIRVTVIHELYHAIQLGYHPFTKETFWFEASASGIEEIANPDIDDYFSYLSSMSTKVGTPLNQMGQPYGAGILLIYLYNFVDKKIDKAIWENYKKNPNKLFPEQLKAVIDQKKLSVDSLFQDFATRLSFAGNRSTFIDSTELICKDEPRWPEFSYIQLKTNGDNKSVKPAINDLAYKFYSNGSPILEDFLGQVSAVAYQGKSAQIENFKTTNDADLFYAQASANSSIDSIAWIFSNFNSQEYLPTVLKDSTLRAYPVPWREGYLCFTPLPHDKHFIEIRNRRGNLISREKYEGSTLCLEESRVRELMAPGVYRFRVGNSGKTKDFIIIY